MSKPIITRIEIHEFEYEIREDITPEGFYEPGAVSIRGGNGLRIHTDIGVSGEYVTGWPLVPTMLRSFIPYLVGRNALEREKICIDMKSKIHRLGMGIIDTALWDLAGKYYDAPIYELLGGYRKKLPCTACTTRGDHSKGGLNSPEAFADFAEQCLEMGYPALKIGSWTDVSLKSIKQEIATVHAIGKRVGGKMDLMLDGLCSYNTLADAVKVGRALDEEVFFWYEDPFQDGGLSQFAHRKLRQLIKTPLLLTETTTSLEPKIDFVLADATDFLRGDVDSDGGITGTMKLAHAAEGLGIDVEIHGGGPGSRHCMAAMRNSNYHEIAYAHPKVSHRSPPIFKSDYRDGLDAIDKDGCVTVPEGPGLGVEYDWDFIMKHRTGGAEYK